MSRRSSPSPVRSPSRAKSSTKKDGEAGKPAGPLEPCDVVRGWADAYQKRAQTTHAPVISAIVNSMYEAIGDNVYLTKLVFQARQSVLKEGALACLFASARSVFYSHLTMLFFWRLAISEDDMCVLAQFLSKYGYIHTLELFHNDLSPKCALKLGHLLSINRGLRTVVLDLNVLNADAVSAISAGICESRLALQTLSMNYCQCGPDAAPAIAAIVRSSVTLRELRLDGNKLKSTGARDIFTALCDNRSIERLSMADNMIDFEPSETAMAALRQALTSEIVLLRLNLDMNLISTRAASLILEGMSERRLRKLRGLDIHVTHRLPTVVLDSIERLCEKVTDSKRKRRSAKSSGRGSGRAKSGSAGSRKK